MTTNATTTSTIPVSLTTSNNNFRHKDDNNEDSPKVREHKQQEQQQQQQQQQKQQVVEEDEINSSDEALCEMLGITSLDNMNMDNYDDYDDDDYDDDDYDDKNNVRCCHKDTTTTTSSSLFQKYYNEHLKQKHNYQNQNQQYDDDDEAKKSSIQLPKIPQQELINLVKKYDLSKQYEETSMCIFPSQLSIPAKFMRHITEELIWSSSSTTTTTPITATTNNNNITNNNTPPYYHSDRSYEMIQVMKFKNKNKEKKKKNNYNNNIEKDNNDDNDNDDEYIIEQRRTLTRLENFVNTHSEWYMLCYGYIQQCISAIVGIDMVLFKEKLNLKPPGGSGFAPHLDTPSLRIAFSSIQNNLITNNATTTTTTTTTTSSSSSSIRNNNVNNNDNVDTNTSKTTTGSSTDETKNLVSNNDSSNCNTNGITTTTTNNNNNLIIDDNGPQTFVTVMVAIDDMTSKNGCLRICKGKWSEQYHIDVIPPKIDGNPDGSGRAGAIPTELVNNNLQFDDITCKGGTIIPFNGWVPHRSSPNKSFFPRRAVFLTYNPKSEGNYHDIYYNKMNQLRTNYRNQIMKDIGYSSQQQDKDTQFELQALSTIPKI